MKAERKKLPVEASEFIQIHYPDSFVQSVKPIKKGEKQIGFRVELVHDEVVSHIMFDAEGNEVKESNDPLFSEDYYEGDFYGHED